MAFSSLNTTVVVQRRHQMAGVHHERVVGRRLHGQAQKFDRSAPRVERVRGWSLLRNRAIIWILSGILLGAAAGWTVFRAFLVLVTLD
jgi:hypothetical protein